MVAHLKETSQRKDSNIEIVEHKELKSSEQLEEENIYTYIFVYMFCRIDMF